MVSDFWFQKLAPPPQKPSRKWPPGGQSGIVVEEPSGDTVMVMLTAGTNIAAGTAVAINSSGQAVQTWGPVPNISGTVNIFSAPKGGWVTNAGIPLTIILSGGGGFVSFVPAGSPPTTTIGAALPCTISGTSISTGTLKTDASFNGFLTAAPLSSTSFVYAYVSGGDIKINVGTISSGVISLGTPATATGGTNATSYDIFSSIAALSATSFIFTYLTASDVAAIVGSISGTTVSLGTPQTGFAAGLMPIVISSTEVVLIDQWSAVVGTISGTSLSLGTPVSIPTLSPQNGPYGAKTDGTHFVVTWGDNSSVGVYSNYAAVGVIVAGAITFGSAAIVSPASETVAGILVLSSSSLVFYGFWTTPTIATVSSTTLTPTSPGFLPLEWLAPANQYGAGLTTGFAFGWQSIVAINSSQFIFQDGNWNIYEGDTSGNISPAISHTPGFYNYELYPVNSTTVLATFTNYDGSIQARVITFQPINKSGPVAVSSSAVSNGNVGTFTISGLSTGFSGLTAGTQYYVNGDGTLTTANTGRPAGVATSSSSLLVEFR